MNTKAYIKKYHLDEPEKSDFFDRKAFIKDLQQEFNEQFQNTLVVRAKQGLGMEFNIFQQIVKNIQAKYNAISNKKIGEPLTEKLFSAFYAIAVIPIRAKYYPEEHEKISLKKGLISKDSQESPKKGDNNNPQD